MGWTPLFLPNARRRRIERAARRFAQLTEEARQACLTRGDDPSTCILAGLMAAEGDGRRGTPREICEEAAMMFVGGKETAGPAAAWTASLLARHPEIQERAADEVFRVVGPRDVTAADMTQLKLLDAVYNETLRLYPPAFMFMREAVRPTAIGGYRVPRRSMVCLFVYAAQRDPRWFDAPDEFRPERFLEPAARDFAHAFVPFGIGKRACPGGRLATVQTLAALATLLQQHRLIWDSAKPVPTPLIYMGLRPPADLGVRLEPAERNAFLPRQPR
jgi:cytochrome P450